MSGQVSRGSVAEYQANERAEVTRLRWRPLLCLEGVPDLPVAPQDEAGLTKTFQTWPRGWFHIP